MRRYLLWLMVGFFFTLSSCSDDDQAVVYNDVNEFVWFAMNEYYYWQADVAELNDEVRSTENNLNSFLATYTSPEELFDDLLYPEDRFSWIVDDYEELENSFQGISKSFGYEFRLIGIEDSDQIFGFVKYIVPNSPADNASLLRGDIFTEVDGIQLTRNNYPELLFEKDSYTLTLAEIVDDQLQNTNEKISMEAVQLTENPILLSKVMDEAGIKVGYLVYNQFINSDEYHRELNNVFGDFISQGVEELVLDLRYNPGGSINTTAILASLIYGAATKEDVFGSIIYNEKLSVLNSDITFFESISNVEGQMHRLDIDRIFILTSNNTASASELIIAGLLPFMDVFLIGTQTVGKNVGSTTLYDSPENAYLNKGDDLNPNHRYALQPIISQLANSDGFTDYINGFAPDVEIDELDLLGDLKPLGDPEEDLLATALGMISGVARATKIPERNDLIPLFDSRKNPRLETINIESEYLPKGLPVN